MANWYVSTTGSDSAAGSSSGTAWLTVNHALAHTGTSASVAAGDTIYVAPGVYYGTAQAIAMSGSAGNNISLIGDVTGYYTGSSPGEVILSTRTNATSAVITSNTLLGFTGRSYWTLQYLTMEASAQSVNGNCLNLNTGKNISFLDCRFLALAGVNDIAMVNSAPAAGAANILFDRCLFDANFGWAIKFTLAETNTTGLGPGGANSDYNAGVTIRNTAFRGSQVAVSVNSSGSGTYLPGGVVIDQCSFFYQSTYAIQQGSASGISTTYPIVAQNSFFVGGGTALQSANASSLIDQGTNGFATAVACSGVTRTSAASGANFLAFEQGQSFQEPRPARPYGTPLSISPAVGMGTSALQNGTGYSEPAGNNVDNINRPRPGAFSAGNKTAGAHELHDSAVLGGAGNAYSSNPNCLAIGPGPGDHDFTIPVVNGSNSVAIYFNTASTSGSTYPSVTALANLALGISATTVTAGSNATSYTLLTLSFTASAAGVAKIRVQNYDAAGTLYIGSVNAGSVNTGQCSSAVVGVPVSLLDTPSGGGGTTYNFAMEG